MIALYLAYVRGLNVCAYNSLLSYDQEAQQLAVRGLCVQRTYNSLLSYAFGIVALATIAVGLLTRLTILC